MTQTFFLSQLRSLALIVIAYCAGRGWLSPQDSGALTAILVPIGAIAGPWIWSIYANINAKLVHADSAAAKVAAIEKTNPVDALNAASRLAEKVATVLMLAFAVSVFLAMVPAMAQGRKTVTPAPRPVFCDPANLIPGCKPQPTAMDASGNPIASIIAKPLQDLANFIQGDLAGAAALAVAIPNLQDGNGQACWLALAAAGAVFKAHPLPVTFQGATDLEAIRLLNMAANQVCTNSACTQVFNEATNLIDAAAPITVAIPSLAALCSKIPEIAVVAPIAAGVPPPAAVLSPAQGNPALGAGPTNPAAAPVENAPATTKP